jgi:hypothetical protein
MNLETFHVHNVVNSNPAYSQRIGDERTVATPWNRFRTHNPARLLFGQSHARTNGVCAFRGFRSRHFFSSSFGLTAGDPKRYLRQ